MKHRVVRLTVGQDAEKVSPVVREALRRLSLPEALEEQG
jgi:hypothetical protein